MWGSVRVKTAPAALPLSAADLRQRLRLDLTGDDATDAAEDRLLDDLQRAALSEIDGPDGIGVAVTRQTWTLARDGFAPVICLPGAPVAEVLAVRYLDAAGEWQSVPAGDFRLVASVEPVRLVPARGFSWPACPAGPGVVEIDYALGAADPAAADPGLVTAVALLVGHYYENREAVVTGGKPEEMPLGVRHILARHRRGQVAG